MNKLISGIIAIGIYLGLLFLILLYYNIHEKKARDYVEKNSNRVTVTLINSDKTVFNRSSKHSIPTKPLRVHHPIKHNKSHITSPKPKIVQHHIKPKNKEPKKVHTPTKKEIEAKKIAEAKARRAKERAKRLAREAKAKKEAQRLARIAREKRKKEEAKARAEEIKRAKAKREAQRLARIAREKKKKEEAKARAEEIKRAKAKKEAQRLARIAREKKKKEQEAKARAERIKKEKEKKRLARIRAERERKRRIKERSKNLFSSVNIHSSNKSPKTPPKERSHIRHTSSVADRIRNTHLSGRVSNRNRERGVENAYIAKVKNQLNNWNAQSNYKGHHATIILTIMSSGKFRYTIKRSSSGALTRGLREFLDQLNRIGLGQHNKSTPYVISVTFRAR